MGAGQGQGERKVTDGTLYRLFWEKGNTVCILWSTTNVESS